VSYSGRCPRRERTIGTGVFKASGDQKLREARGCLEAVVVTADLTIEITRRGLCFSASKQNENLSFEPDSNIQETDLEAYRIDPSLTEAQHQDLIAT
jgi:hypothetical protein